MPHSPLYNAIQQLCADNGTNITAMCRELGITRSALSELAHGRTKSLSAVTIARIAAHFSVPADILLGLPSQPELSPLYFRFAQQAQALELSAHDLELALEFLNDHKKRNTGEA